MKWLTSRRAPQSSMIYVRSSPPRAGVTATATAPAITIAQFRAAINTIYGIANTAAAQDVSQRLRADTVSEPDRREAFQAVAPQTEAGLYLVPQVIEGLKQEGADDILVVCGGVIPPKDYAGLLELGVAAIYGPGTNIPVAASEVIQLIRKRRLAA